MYAPVVMFHVLTFDAKSTKWWLFTSLTAVVSIAGLILSPFPKHVAVYEQNIVVTAVIRKVSATVPLTAIEEIRPSLISKMVTITLKTKSPVGRKINFMPTASTFSHPALGNKDVALLQQAVVDARVRLDESKAMPEN